MVHNSLKILTLGLESRLFPKISSWARTVTKCTSTVFRNIPHVSEKGKSDLILSIFCRKSNLENCPYSFQKSSGLHWTVPYDLIIHQGGLDVGHLRDPKPSIGYQDVINSQGHIRLNILSEKRNSSTFWFIYIILLINESEFKNRFFCSTTR